MLPTPSPVATDSVDGAMDVPRFFCVPPPLPAPAPASAPALAPTTPQLVRPRDAFDPEVPELPALLPESRFPNTIFRHPDVLAALRPLGLQSALDWPALVEAAASVESSHLERGKEEGGGEGGKGNQEEAARVRGRALMTYLDTHEVRLFDLQKQTPGLFQKLAQRVFQDPDAGRKERQRAAALHQLAVLSWVSPFGGIGVNSFSRVWVLYGIVCVERASSY